jgi:hypothetical protein
LEENLLSFDPCDVEIVERVSDLEGMRGSPLKPYVVRINGSEVLIPEGTEIEVSPIGPKNCVSLTLTLFPSSLKIFAEESQ